ncbi:MAG: 4Fe-4S ferredoxin [Candidatus Schekmanbacteria bacterium RBG_13_48_7]|uniref:4Fe-4S ferredoxin n=1 Tax=Candidatus Schekmanbacteria bacterium RBG_13_48_7 TaxID=1817878 RepID=A0A1F7RQL4_9BACT|nr:MAG: 4Fe-4S ferredoxin [Candidatus Schekmanbacteria bacterium RBG_13_48_7]
MLRNDGIPTKEDLDKVTPPDKILDTKAVAILECFQEIPCDPCHAACKQKAIQNFKDINDLPEIKWEECDGCGICVATCPGLAVFIVDKTFSDTEAKLILPYEFTPLPKKGQIVDGLDRSGKPVTKARVLKVVKHKTKTWLLYIAVPKQFAMDVRHIKF